MNDYKDILEKYKKNKIDIDLRDIIKFNILKILLSITRDLEFIGEITSKHFIEEIYQLIKTNDLKIDELSKLEDMINEQDNKTTNKKIGNKRGIE
jgi:hypothetical protein